MPTYLCYYVQIKAVQLFIYVFKTTHDIAIPILLYILQYYTSNILYGIKYIIVKTYYSMCTK